MVHCVPLCRLDDAKTAKKGRKRKLVAPDGPKRPTVICSNSGTKSPAKKKAKKRNPWSDSEGSDGNDSDRSDLDMDMDDSFANVVEREKAPRRAAGQICRFYSDSVTV